jgi:SAM-dependent methyltransferase
VKDDFYPHQVDWTPEKVARVWNFYGSHSEFKDDHFSYHSGAQIVKWARNVIPFSQKTVLDYGCGAGYLLKSILLYTDALYCVGIEFSNDSLEAAQKLLAGDTRFHGVVLVQKIPVDLPDFFADIVFMVEVIEHLDTNELNSALHELNRLVKQGGYLVLTTPNNENIESKKRICPDCGAIFHPKQHVRSWNAQKIQETLEGYGVEIISIIETNWEYRKKNFISRFFYKLINILRGQQELGKKHLGVIVRKVKEL